MDKNGLKKMMREPLFQIGVGMQCLSVLLIGLLLLALRLEWIDYVKIGLENGIDKPSLKLEALYWIFYFLVNAFVSGSVQNRSPAIRDRRSGFSEGNAGCQRKRF
ncbi:MAG: hypothetical protein HZA89_00765 [Verrucomicrobia bacterium]|nr:hypothetical protein [Verrucomicrobiota bacterium]